jgi:hypothetical protein
MGEFACERKNVGGWNGFVCNCFVVATLRHNTAAHTHECHRGVSVPDTVAIDIDVNGWTGSNLREGEKRVWT